ncbi:MAG: DUF2238 domain-containing protein [Nanoarchaeota archaeon]
MFLKRGQLQILIANILLILIFLPLAIKKENYEFVMYIGVIIIFFALIVATNKRNNLGNFVLWGLTGWALIHMCGGFVYINGARLYEIMVLNIIKTESIYLFRYDQLVHMYGFGVATLIGYDVLKPYLNFNKINWKVLSALLVLIGMGLGALNEVIEFLAVVTVPQTGVGGFYNTAWDLTFNMVGAIIAVIIVNLRKSKCQEPYTKASGM